MPYLWRDITDAAIFLYPTIDDAHTRTKGGGSGFLIGVPSQSNPVLVHVYAVTNDHVSRPCPHIRLAKLNGNVQIVPGADTDWIDHPDGDDVAVRPLALQAAPLDVMRKQRIPIDAYSYLDASEVIATEDFRFGVGPSIGEECLMVGRYVNHEGAQFDRGVVRFGNLSAYPEMVWQRLRNREQESFLVDMRSSSGYSGSPVLVYYTAPGKISVTIDDPNAIWRTLISKSWLLGIDWGHLPVRHDILEDGRATRALVESSMTAVVPGWKLTELLNSGEVADARERADAEIAQRGADELDSDLDGFPELQRYAAIASHFVDAPNE